MGPLKSTKCVAKNKPSCGDVDGNIKQVRVLKCGEKNGHDVKKSHCRRKGLIHRKLIERKRLWKQMTKSGVMKSADEDEAS